MNNLLDFPDEILCKIFEYLNPFDAIYSFFNLNNRFNRLLESFKQQIDLTNISYEHFQYYIQIILPILNKDQRLTVIKLGNKRTPNQIKLFNQLIQNNEDYRDYFKYIERILLQSIRLDELIEFATEYLSILTNLKVLVIQIDHIEDRNIPRLTQLIINSIFSLKTIIKLSIEMSSGVVLSRLPVDITFHSLIYLNINLSISTDLLILIQHIPNIENLIIYISWWTSGDRTFIKILDEIRSNNTRQSFLEKLKKFRLIIHSIITFQFEHLEQILYRILHVQTTFYFSLILRNGLIRNDESNKLINGQQWQKLLQFYPLLIHFELYVQINGLMSDDDQIFQLDTFYSKYFQDKSWTFAFWKNSIRKQMILYSIPYKTKEILDISIDTETLLKNIPINYAKYLSIEQIDTTTYPLTFQFLMKYFPFLEQLNINYINTNSSINTSMNLPSLHTLRISREQDIQLSNLLRLFPSITTLSLYLNPFNRSQLIENLNQYNRIIDLHLIGISQMNIDRLVEFLKQFSNLRFLHINIQHRRISNEILLRYLNDVIQTCQSLINLKIQLDCDIERLIDFEYQLHIRTKMKLTDVIFDGIIIHLWF